jgi:hypothetical protein
MTGRGTSTNYGEGSHGFFLCASPSRGHFRYRSAALSPLAWWGRGVARGRMGRGSPGPPGVKKAQLETVGATAEIPGIAIVAGVAVSE